MDKTIEFLLQRLQNSPEDWEIRRHLMEVCVELDDGARAVDLIREAPNLPTSDEDLLVAINIVGQLDPWAALGFAERAVAEDDNRAVAHLAKSRACYLTNQAEPASRHYGIALSHDAALADPGFEQLPAGSPTPAPAAVPAPAAAAVVPAAAVAPEEVPTIEEAVLPTAAEVPAPAVAEMTPPPAVAEEIPQPVIEATPIAEQELTAAAALPVIAPLVDPNSIPETPELVAEPLAAEEAAPLSFTPADELELTRSHLAVPTVEGDLVDADQLPEAGYFEEDPGLLVGEGDLAPDPAERKNRSAGVSALITTIIVHAVIFAIIGLIVVAAPRVFPPEIVAVTSPLPASEQVAKKQVQQMAPEKPNVQPAPAVQTLSSAASSPVSIPSVDFATPDAPVELGSSFASNVGFGAAGAGGGIPFVMKSRCSKAERAKMLTEHGGSAKVSSAVEKSLRWFADNQNEDGSWGAGHRGGLTGLALLSFLGNCETPDSPRYGDNVMKGLMYLVELSGKNEGVMAERMDGHYAYEHGIATYAMGETYALAKYGKRQLPGVREAFERGVDIIIEGQTTPGSWDYHYAGDPNWNKGRKDTSVTGWQYQALKAAKHTNLKFSKLQGTIRDAVDYLETVQGPDGGFGYSGPKDKWSLTGAGVLGLQMIGSSGNKSEIKKGLKYIHEGGQEGDKTTWHGKENLKWDKPGSNLYAWYYNTQACFQAGGEDWDKWNAVFRDELLNNQKEDGHWDKSNGHSHNGDPVYITALCTLMLEVYYRYLPATADKGGSGF